MKLSLQKIYNVNLILALLVCVLGVLWLVVLWLSIVPISRGIGEAILLLSIAFFLPLNIFLLFQNSSRHLRLPDFISSTWMNTSHILAVVAFVTTMITGLVLYPSAPIREIDGKYFDKAESEYILEQFMTFQKWETTYLIFWTVFALQSVVILPFFDRSTRKWKLQ